MTETAWYASEDGRKSVRQAVVEMNKPSPVESKFGKLMLGENYRTLMTSFWAVGLFRLERDPGPHLLLRADGHTTRFRAQPFRVAFCFYRMKAGGLFALFVDFPKLRIPTSPYAPYVLFGLFLRLFGACEVSPLYFLQRSKMGRTVSAPPWWFGSEDG
jgi:hypothetical protein